MEQRTSKSGMPYFPIYHLLILLAHARKSNEFTLAQNYKLIIVHSSTKIKSNSISIVFCAQKTVCTVFNGIMDL